MDIKLLLAPVFCVLTKNVGEYENFPNISLASLKAYINGHYQSQVIDLNARLLKNNHDLFHQLYLFDETRYRPLQYLNKEQVKQLEYFNFSDLPDLSLLLSLTGEDIGYKKISSIDFLGLNDDQARELVDQIDQETEKDLQQVSQDCHIFALSIFQSNIYYAACLAKKLKKKNKDNVVIFGGPSLAYLPLVKLLLKLGICDYIILGEGEKSFLQILDYLLKGQGSLPGVKNLAYKNDGEVLINEGCDYIENLDLLPEPDYSDYDLSFLQKTGTPVAFSRGCPYQCSFCSAANFWPAFRTMSVSRSIEIIKQYVEEKQIKKFFIFNPTVNVSEKWLNDLCLELIKADLQIDWSGSFRAQNLSQETIANLKKSGCNYVDLAIENVDQKILDKMNKGITVRKAVAVIADLLLSGIKLRLHLIVGFPGEKWHNFLKNLNFLKSFLQKVPAGSYYNFYISELFIDTNSAIFKKPDQYGIKIRKLDINPTVDLPFKKELQDLNIKWFIDNEYRDQTYLKVKLMNKLKQGKN